MKILDIYFSEKNHLILINMFTIELTSLDMIKIYQKINIYTYIGQQQIIRSWSNKT